MPRPTFSPDPEQARTLRELARQAARLSDAEARRTELITRANAQGIPIEHIARAAAVTVKTVYRRLGRPMK